MDAFPRVSRTEKETRLQQALVALSTKTYNSIRASARAFGVPEATLRHRMAGRDSRMQAQEHRQNLSPAEEKTLLRWIARLTKSGYPASPALVLEMAEEIAHQRYQLSKAPPLQQSFGKHWLERFRARHTEIQGVWTRQIESARYNATNVEV